ncbi:MAG: hypothetical protein Q8M07_26505 [Prosthecobacter sp.]|nr:hypothetical protein [Prosthecobacter sp.]
MNADPIKTRVLVSKAPVITVEPEFLPAHNPVIRRVLLRPLALVIGGIVLLMWCLLGFYLWIPLLIRTCAAFSFAIVSAAVSGHDISGAERALSSAMGFYTRGFTVIYQSVGRVLEERLSPTPLESQAPVSWKRTIIEFSLASVMWTAPFVIYQLVQPIKPALDSPIRSESLKEENIDRASSLGASQFQTRELSVSINNGADKDQQLKGLLVGSWSCHSGRIEYFADGRYANHPNREADEEGLWQIKNGVLIHDPKNGKPRLNKIVNVDARQLALEFGDGPRIYYSRDEAADKQAPVPAPPATAERVTAAEVRSFIIAHHSKASRGDIAGLVADYDRTVSFLDKGLLSPSEIQEEEAKDRENWPKGGERVIGEPAVARVETHWVATYTVDFYRENAAGRWHSGKIDLRLTIRPESAGLLITTQRAKVYDIRKGKSR